MREMVKNMAQREIRLNLRASPEQRELIEKNAAKHFWHESAGGEFIFQFGENLADTARRE
jgi:uncharacterized protein (DUF1778 family)